MNSENGQIKKRPVSQTGTGLVKYIWAAGDYAAVVAAEFLALFLRNFFMDYSVFHVAPVYFWLITPMIFLLFLSVNQMYGRQMLFYQAVEKIFFSCLYSILFAVVLMFAGQVSGEVSRLYVGLLAVTGFLCLVGMRYFLKKTVGRSALLRIPVLIVGAGLTADAVVREFKKDSGLNYTVIGFLEDHEPKTDYVKEYPILGGFADLEKVVAETGVRNVLIAAPGLAQEQLADLLYRAQSICSDVGVVPNLVEVPMSNVAVESYYDAKVMILHVQNNLAKRANRILKYCFEWIAAIIGVILISPLLGYIAWRIRMDSPGPVIYAGERVGQSGKPFKCYKFRSMYVDSDMVLKDYLVKYPDEMINWKVYHKLENDPRVTPVGRMLRRTSLDELPQIFNVLKGEMGLVGPRPYLVKELPDMGDARNVILMARPGITGYWQTSGRSEVSFAERLHMESWYVCNWSIWMDIVLLWRTIKVVAGRKGAY